MNFKHFPFFLQNDLPLSRLQNIFYYSQTLFWENKRKLIANLNSELISMSCKLMNFFQHSTDECKFEKKRKREKIVILKLLYIDVLAFVNSQL